MSQSLLIFLIGQAVAFAGALLKIYLDMTIKINELDIRVNQAESKDEVLFKKLDKISEQLTQLSISLQNKQDKVIPILKIANKGNDYLNY